MPSLAISPETLGLRPDPPTPWTRAQVRACEPPRCPACGRMVFLNWHDVSLSGEPAAWVPEGWRCPTGCQPRRKPTGRRTVGPYRRRPRHNERAYPRRT